MHDLFGFIASSSPAEWSAVVIPVVAIIFIFSIPISAIITEYFQKKNKARLMERAIEAGVPVDAIKLDDEPRRRMPYRSGMVTCAVGLGTIVFGLLMSKAILGMDDPEGAVAGWVFAGLGLLVLFIGAALLINDRMNSDRFKNGNGR